LLWQAYLDILVQKKEHLKMEISFVIEWASVLIGFVLGLLTFFAVAIAIAYRMKKSELSEVYKVSGKQKK
jgi:ABC-type antimicrobial peptide transport system permease subunit